MDTKLKKMTANIKGVKGWFILTVFGLDVLLGIAGGNLISSFYGDVIIYVGFLVTVAAGIMLTVSLKSDSREWSSLTIFDIILAGGFYCHLYNGCFCLDCRFI